MSDKMKETVKIKLNTSLTIKSMSIKRNTEIVDI